MCMCVFTWIRICIVHRVLDIHLLHSTLHKPVHGLIWSSLGVALPSTAVSKIPPAGQKNLCTFVFMLQVEFSVVKSTQYKLLTIPLRIFKGYWWKMHCHTWRWLAGRCPLWLWGCRGVSHSQLRPPWQTGTLAQPVESVHQQPRRFPGSGSSQG